MACHNRAQTTNIFFESLKASKTDRFNFQFYVTDDGSTDDTYNILKSQPFRTKILKGDGSLFWAKSMAKAEESIDCLPDGILWVNDDLELLPNCFENLYKSIQLHPRAVLVGQVLRRKTNKIIYGGYRSSSAHPLKISLLERTQTENPDTFNGNFVYIPTEVRLAVGPINSRYSHAYADCDYGYRVRKIGYEIKLIPDAIGEGETNKSPEFVTKREALKFFYNKKNNRLSDQIYFLLKFTKLKYKIFIPIFLLSPFLKIVILNKY